MAVEPLKILVHYLVGHIRLTVLSLCFVPVLIQAQVNPPLPFDPLKFLPKNEVKDTSKAERRIIEIRSADQLEQETDSISSVLKRKLKGNVRLLHDGAIMTCDSAILYPDGNYLEAFSRVTIRKSDSVEIKSGTLIYYGDTKFARLEKNVRLRDKNSLLEAPIMDYDVGTDIGNFYQGGKLTSDSTILTSDYGTYYQQQKTAIFKKNVVLVHPDYTMTADSMRYDTKTKIAYFISPTTIITKEDTIFTSSGFFDTEKNKANFGNRPLVKKGKENTLQADILDYNKASGNGFASGNVVSKNTKDKVTLLSGNVFYADSTDYVKSTVNPLMIKEGEKDTLYLSADTLISFKEYMKDSSGQITDSIKIFYGHKNVKTIQGSMSGICDSIYFSGQDSIFRLFYEPYLWMDSTQMHADTVLMFMENEKIVKIELRQNAIIIQESDPGVYNQIKGRFITGLLEDNQLRKVLVNGNAECIYFVQDDSSAYLGANKSQSATIEADFNEDNKIDRIKLDIQPEAVFTPIHLIDWAIFRLEGFRWIWKKKPQDKWDVIRDSTQYMKFIEGSVPSDTLQTETKAIPSSVPDNIPDEKTNPVVPADMPEVPARKLPDPSKELLEFPKSKKDIRKGKTSP
jgi:lipopolysaccharide export system protein LptA